MFKASCHLHKAIKWLTNYHKQAAEGEKAKTCSLCFSQFPFNLTQAFVLSLKAPFPLMASLLSFTLQWQHTEYALSSWMQPPKYSTDIIYTLRSIPPIYQMLFSLKRYCLLLRQMIYSRRAKAFLRNKTKHHERRITFSSPLKTLGNTLIFLQWLWGSSLN